MQLRGRPGYCFITTDPDIERSLGGIWYPKQLQGKAKTGLVLLHCISSSWDEVDLTNKKVVFDRWAGKPFKLKWSDGKEYTFVSVSQWSVLGIVEPYNTGAAK